MLMILARLGRSESFWAVVKVRSPHTSPEVWYPRRRRGWRAGGRANEQSDVAQLRAGGYDRADDVGGGHATRERAAGAL